LSLSSRQEEIEMSRLKLTHWQRRRLRQQLKATSDARTYRRTLAVLELDRGHSAADIAAMLGVTRQSVHNWAAAFVHEPDPSVLCDADRSGRPPLLAEPTEAHLRGLMGQSPQDFGYPHTDWTVPLLRQELEKDLGLRPSDETVRRMLRRLGYLWKRPRYVLDSDPEREKKTADSSANPGLAAPERRAGPGRDRLDDVPATAGGLVEEGRTGEGPHQRLERPEGDLRGDEPPDRDTADASTAQGTIR
jgi:transposase